MKQSQLLVASILIIAAAILPGCARSDPPPVTETVPPPRHTNMAAAIYPGATLQNVGLDDQRRLDHVAANVATDRQPGDVTAWYRKRYETWADGRPLQVLTMDRFGTPLTIIALREGSPLRYPQVFVRVLPIGMGPSGTGDEAVQPIGRGCHRRRKYRLYGDFPMPNTARRSEASEEEFERWIAAPEQLNAVNSAIDGSLQVGDATLQGVGLTAGPEMGTRS